MVQRSVISKRGLRPAGSARPLQARGPGWRRAERPRGASRVLFQQDAPGRLGAGRFVGHIFEPLPLPF